MKKLIQKLKASPINYFSDLFIIGVVIFWMLFCLVGMIMAVIVTVASVIISYDSNMAQFDVILWGTVSTVVTVPITTGIGMWLAKCAGQHWQAAKQGKEAEYDFPAEQEPQEDTAKG